MPVYDEKARLKLAEGIRRQIGEIDGEIDTLKKRQEEVTAAQDALQKIEAVLRRMSMLAREATKSEKRRPGMLEEFEECKRMVSEFSRLAVVDGKSVLQENVLRELTESLTIRLVPD